MGSKVISADRETRQVLDAIRRLVRSLRESSRAAEKRVGLSGAQLFVLQVLDRNGALSVNELAAATVTHQSSVSVVVARLVGHGLVSRVQSSGDRRRLELSLTVKGRKLLRRSPGVAQERLIDGLRRMSSTERRTLAASLVRLVKRMGIEAAAPSMFFEEPARG